MIDVYIDIQAFFVSTVWNAQDKQANVLLNKWHNYKYIFLITFDIL